MPSGSTPEPPAGPGQRRRRFWLALRLGLGAAIFAAVVLWVVREGDYLRNLSWRVLAASTAVSLLTALLHARTLQVVAATYGRSLGYPEALRIASLASIGNAAGGLPLGTALKFSVMHERVGLRLAEIAAGMAAFTVGISLTLMLVAALSIAASGVPAVTKGLALGIWVVAVVGTATAAALLARHRRLSSLVRPFTVARHLAHCAALSGVVAGSFVLNACATGALLLPAASLNDLAFISSAGILLGLLSFLQGVAGIQEVAMALVALTVGVDAIDGAQIALTLRATAMGASVILLLAQLVLRWSAQRAR